MSQPDPIARTLADFAGAVRFFSRLPIPSLSVADDPAAMPRFERAARLVPLAGAAIALPAAAAGAVLGLTALPAIVVGALVVAVMALTTGAMHEDGLADTADGLAGGHTAERRLTIMKDSRIGVFGGVALALSLLVRAGATGALLVAAPVAGALAVVAAAAIGRTGAVAIWHRLPNARTDGLSVAAGRPDRRAAVTAGLLGLLLGLLGLPAGGPVGVLLGLALAAGAVWLMMAAARRAIGGQTGDILGAGVQVAEIGFLVGLAAL